MLLELSITNLAIIEHTRIRFQDGLNAITGETGAGKSILLDALGAVLGTRVSSDLVRSGASAALVEAQVDLAPANIGPVLSILEDIGIKHDPAEPLILSREITANGRSTARVNGRLVTVGQLNQIGSLLVDIHGQSDHLAILNPAEQLRILDRYAGVEALLVETAGAVSDWRAAQRAVSELESGSREREQRRDLLRYQIAEIDELNPRPGEDDDLVRERDVLRNADELRLLVMGALAALVNDTEEADIGTRIREVEYQVGEAAALDPSVQNLAERATEIVVLAEDLGRDLRDYAERLEADPDRLATVDERLDGLQTLKRKYGSTLTAVIQYRDQAAVELEELSAGNYDPTVLQERERIAAEKAGALAVKLSDQRAMAAKKLAEAIVKSIADLHMGNAAMEIRLTQTEEEHGLDLPDGRRVHVDSSGIDSALFLIAPNVGEALKPLGRIASGGETARIMLAIKSILSDADETPTLVFDEIDVGVGGRSGQMVGEKLWSLTDRHQIIVISHLAQIAAFADKHFRISKHDVDGRTVSTVDELDPLTREQELAAMLDGIPATPESLANARAMLQRVHDYREKRAR